MDRRPAGGTSRFPQSPSTGPLSRTSGFAADPRLDAWLRALLATPGLTSIRDPHEARRRHLDDSLAGLELVAGFPGPIVDVGSGGGAPGIPLAAALPEREVTLLEASKRKCAFLERVAADFSNVHATRGRAEEQEPDGFGVAVAKALAPPVVAAEWCLPLVRPDGAAVLWVGPSAEPARVARAAERLAAELVDSPPGFFVLRKLGPTPPGFPRRPGVARKRPLA
jgi:16S rRNA (guanine527-N7)-methyltransferase